MMREERTYGHSNKKGLSYHSMDICTLYFHFHLKQYASPSRRHEYLQQICCTFAHYVLCILSLSHGSNLTSCRETDNMTCCAIIIVDYCSSLNILACNSNTMNPFTEPTLPPNVHADKLLPCDLCSTKCSLQITDQGVALCFWFEMHLPFN